MIPTFFSNQIDFRAWLETHHQTEKELLVGYYKVNSKKPSMTWSESVDQALCFGWIDGVRKGIDDDSYCIRFTPRKSTSIWSTVNIKKMEELTAVGLMTPSGLAAFSKRTESKSNIYAYEQAPAILDATYENQFKANSMAWDFFSKQAPSYQRTIVHWIMSAKQEETKLSRLQKIINASEQQKRFN